MKLSTEGLGICERCGKYKLVHLYGLQDGSTAFVCQDCRNPTQHKKAQ